MIYIVTHVFRGPDGLTQNQIHDAVCKATEAIGGEMGCTKVGSDFGSLGTVVEVQVEGEQEKAPVKLNSLGRPRRSYVDKEAHKAKLRDREIKSWKPGL